MKRLVISFTAVVMLSLLAVGSLPVRQVEAGTYNGSLPSLTCTAITFPSGTSVTFDRDNTGTGSEELVLIVTDGDGNVLLSVSDQGLLTNTIPFAPSYAYTATPNYNPLTARLVSPAGGTVGEQVVWEVTGTCAGLPNVALVPGCDLSMPITSTSVVGAFVADAAVYSSPGQVADPLITIPAGKTAWVLGQDASGAYYKIVWECSLLWVQKSTLGPNYDNVWNGAPLPTGVVS